MRIAICDDEQTFLDKEYPLIKSVLKDMDITYEIKMYNGADELINADEKFDVAFLDIEMRQGSGFKAAQYLYNQNKNIVITFFTNYSKYIKKGYEFRAFRYILKNEPNELMKEQIAATVKEALKKSRVLSIVYNGEKSSISINDIYYVEAYQHTVIYHTSKGERQEIGKIQDVENDLSRYGFIRCHRSYLVNADYIKYIKGNKIYIMGSKTDYITIGVRYKEFVEKAYVNMHIAED